jgi:hypothetical protein
VVRGRPVGRRVGTAVAGGTLIGHHSLCVIPTAGLPRRNAVTACTVGRRRNVNGGFPAGTAAIVTTPTIACYGESAVIRLATRPIGRRFVTAIASRLSLHVSRWLTGGDATVVATRTTPCGHAGMVELGTGKGLGCVACFTTHLGRHVLLGLHHVVA